MASILKQRNAAENVKFLSYYTNFGSKIDGLERTSLMIKSTKARTFGDRCRLDGQISDNEPGGTMKSVSIPYEAMLGSFLTGFGLSVIYPLLALPVLKSMPDENIGLALSTYESCFDIGILVAGLVCGGIVSLFGYSAVFTFAFFCCLLASISSLLAYKQISNKDVKPMCEKASLN